MHNANSPRNDDEGIEQLIIAKNLPKPRFTPQMIESLVFYEQYHMFPGTQLTVCCLTLRNGFTVTGESACVHPENFDAEIGRRIARANAVQKIWALEGYRLKQQLADEVCFTFAEVEVTA